MKFTTVKCVDVESTGLDPSKDDARVCELGFTDVVFNQETSLWEIDETFSVLVNPLCPIPSTMSGVHNITTDMVKDAPPFSSAAKALLHNPNGVVFCAHRASFERQFITFPAPWICTWKVAVHLAPTAPDYKLGTLRYWLRLDADPTRSSPVHRAGPDSFVCAALVHRMLKKISIEEMVDVSSRPAILPRLFFGKHSGQPLEDVPTGYLHWIVENITDDEDVLATARHHLELRKPQRGMKI